MRVARVVALGAAASALMAPGPRLARSVRRAPLDAVERCGECDDWNPFGDGCKPCAGPDTGSVFVNDVKVSSKVLREVDVVASSGARTAVGDLMTGRGAVVVFLRHLG